MRQNLTSRNSFINSNAMNHNTMKSPSSGAPAAENSAVPSVPPTVELGERFTPAADLVPTLSRKVVVSSVALDVLWSCPSAGAGVHRWLFASARLLHSHYQNDAQIVALLEVASAGCGRRIERREIEDAVRNSRQNALPPGKADSVTTTTEAWPRVDLKKIETITAAGKGVPDLKSKSGQTWKDDGNHAEEIINQLFPGGSLLCVGESLQKFETKPREEWHGKLAKQQFIVPSPMLNKSGRAKAGHLSHRCLENTGPRRFLVIEFDSGTPDQHAALLLHLARLAPLVLVVHSGGKSLHGWFACAGQPEEALRKFMSYAVSLGADPATWTRCQFVRLPDGLRDKCKRQTVLFFNPASIGGAK